MRTPRTLAATMLTLGCLAPPPPRAPSPTLVLLDLSTSGGARLEVGRVPSLRLRFDRPLRLPLPDDLALLRGPASSSVLSDIERLPLSASTAARRIELRAAIDPASPETLLLDAAIALAPDTELALLLSTRLRGVDGAALDAPLAEGLRVAGVTRCGALATALLPGPIAALPDAIPIRFDRGVRAAGIPLGLAGPSGTTLPSSSRLDCFDEEGYARCAWLTPRDPLRAGRYAVLVGDLRARNLARCEAPPMPVEVRDEPSPPPSLAFVTPLPCAPEERSFGGICARIAAQEITLRAATNRPAALRARVTPDDQGDPREALSAASTTHAIRVTGLRPLTRHALSLWALDGRGPPAYLPLGAVDTPTAQGDLRITEVLARPRGSSAQEFVEVENLGREPVALQGWSLASGSGRSTLETPAVLPAGGRALLVGAGFDVRGASRAGDPPTAPGAAVVAVRGSLAGRGLRDDGADLALLDPLGNPVSGFPGGASTRAPRAGVSLVRAAWDLDEDDPHAWAYDAEGDSTPGSFNRAR